MNFGLPPTGARGLSSVHYAYQGELWIDPEAPRYIGGGVAYWAHAGGFIAGLLLTIPLWLRRGGTGFWNRTHGKPPHPEFVYAPSRLPTVRRRR